MRKVIAVAVLILLASGRPAAAQADPDAKGTVTITAVNPNQTSLVVTGTRSAVAGWENGDVQAFAAFSGGGRLYLSNVVAGARVGNWSVTIPNPPNGTYTVYAYHTVVKVNTDPVETQLVGSPLSSGTINVMNNPNAHVTGGTVAFAARSPTRANGGTVMNVTAAYSVNDLSYTLAGGPYFITIPVAGGVVRNGYGSGTAGTWTGQANVPGGLLLNVVMTEALAPKVGNPDTAHHVVSAWATNK